MVMWLPRRESGSSTPAASLLPGRHVAAMRFKICHVTHLSVHTARHGRTSGTRRYKAHGYRDLVISGGTKEHEI